MLEARSLFAAFVALVFMGTLAGPVAADEKAAAVPKGAVNAPAGAKAPAAKPNPRAAARAQMGGRLSPADMAKLTPAERAQRRVTHSWWNRKPLIDLLSLEEEQRKKMDEVFVARLTAAGDPPASMLAANDAFADALETADWPGARAARARVSEEEGKAKLQELETVIAVLELLTNEQRTTLSKDRPFVMRGGWARTGQGMMMQRARQQAKAKAKNAP